MLTIKNLIIKYSTFIKYIISAGFSFLLDLSLFTLFIKLFKGIVGDAAIFIATVCARIISSFFNYLMNRNAVFKSGEKGADTSSLIKYYILVVIQMCVSSLLVFGLFKLTNINETGIKIPVDIFLFVINYFVQKKWIFIKK
jgi:GtrA-like protein.